MRDELRDGGVVGGKGSSFLGARGLRWGRDGERDWGE